MHGCADVDAGWLPQIPANDAPFLVVDDIYEHHRDDGFDHNFDNDSDNDGAFVKLTLIEHDVLIVTAKARLFGFSSINFETRRGEPLAAARFNHAV